LPRPPKEEVISKKEIGARLRALRQARELTQAELAKILCTKHTNVSGVERGIRGLTVQQVVKLAMALDVSPETILGNGGKSMPARPKGSGRASRRLARIQSLPRSKQRVIFEIIDAFIDKNTSSEHA
jgi:transcriptional regulator with XRE-family HTH domain